MERRRSRNKKNCNIKGLMRHRMCFSRPIFNILSTNLSHRVNEALLPAWGTVQFSSKVRAEADFQQQEFQPKARDYSYKLGEST